MNARVENLVWWNVSFFCTYGFECMRTASQNWLTDVTGQLKITCATLCECSCFGGFTEARPVLKSPFIMFCLDLFYLAHLHFHFSSSTPNFRTVSLLVISDFLWHLWQVYSLVSISSSVLFIKAAIALPSSFFTLSCYGLLVRRCHLLFDCVPALVRKFFCHHNSVSVWKGQGQLQELLQKLRSLTVDN